MSKKNISGNALQTAGAIQSCSMSISKLENVVEREKILKTTLNCQLYARVI
jgi:hypothetical protein